jgi:hypothetical protein
VSRKIALMRVCRRAAVTILRNPPARGEYKAGQTVAVAAIRAIIRKEGSDTAVRILQILCAAGVAPIKADHIKAIERLMKEEEFGLLDFDALSASIVAYPSFEKDAKTFAATHGLPLWKALSAVWFQKGKKIRHVASAAASAKDAVANLAVALPAPVQAPTSTVPYDLIRDERVARGSWQPGNQVHRCPSCDDRYRGGPGSKECADCAYAGSAETIS